MRASLFPSPRPSPLPKGRGGIIASLSRFSGLPALAQRGRHCSLSPSERAEVRENTTPVRLRLQLCRNVLAVTLILGGFTSHATSGASTAPDGWQAVAPREEIRPQFSYNPRGGPSHEECLVIRTG